MIYSKMKKLVPLLILFIAVTSCKFIEEKGWFKRDADTIAAYQTRMDSIRVADSINKVLEAERMIEQTRLDSIRAIEEIERERLARFKYHIIVGSFKTPEYADLYAEYYREMGYKTEILFNEYDFNVVSARAFDNIHEALIQLEQFRDTVELEAWLYVNR